MEACSRTARGTLPLLLAFALLVAVALPGAAGAQSAGGEPSDLWRQYPLDQRAPSPPAGPGEPSEAQPGATRGARADEARPRPSGGAGLAPGVVVVLVALGAALLAGGALLVRRRVVLRRERAERVAGLMEGRSSHARWIREMLGDPGRDQRVREAPAEEGGAREVSADRRRFRKGAPELPHDGIVR